MLPTYNNVTKFQPNEILLAILVKVDGIYNTANVVVKLITSLDCSLGNTNQCKVRFEPLSRRWSTSANDTFVTGSTRNVYQLNLIWCIIRKMTFRKLHHITAWKWVQNQGYTMTSINVFYCKVRLISHQDAKALSCKKIPTIIAIS